MRFNIHFTYPSVDITYIILCVLVTSLNLTVNYFSTKYAHHGGLSPSLPLHMKVQVCPMDDLPCFAKLDNNSQLEDEESPEGNEEKEEDDDGSNQSQPENSSASSSNDLYPGDKELEDRHFEKAKEPETVFDDDDRLANFTGFGLLDESVEDEVSHSTEGSVKEKDCWRRSNLITSTSDVEVIDLMTPSPSCRVGSSALKRRRVSEFIIDLTMSPNFIEL